MLDSKFSVKGRKMIEEEMSEREERIIMIGFGQMERKPDEKMVA